MTPSLTSPSLTSPSLLILGTDAVLAAAPATPVQLAHACHAAGYAAVVPVSWGDELIAREAIRALENAKSPLIHAVCPRAARRLADDPAIGPMVFSCAAPPVMTAAYLRAVSAPAPVHITFAGGCTSGAHASIDVWLSPEELLGEFDRRGISLHAQPAEYDAVLTPDRRRHFSEPGGLPCVTALERVIPRASLVELRGDDFSIDLAQHLLGEAPTLIDVGVALGCTCAGAMAGASPQAARARVRELEPPRAPSPVVDHDVELPREVSCVTPPPVANGTQPGRSSAPDPLSAAIPASQGATQPSPGLRVSPAVLTAVADEPAVPEPARRRSPTPGTRVVLGAIPQARGTGRVLPRAYVARRRSSPKEIRESGVQRQVRLAEAGLRPRLLLALALVLVLAVAVLVMMRVG